MRTSLMYVALLAIGMGAFFLLPMAGAQTPPAAPVSPAVPAAPGVPGVPVTPPGRLALQPGVLLSSVVHDYDPRKPEPEKLTVVLRVNPDPALKVAGLQSHVRPDKAQDDGGHSLVPTGAAAAEPIGIESFPVASFQVSVELKPPQVPAGTAAPRSLQVLEGAIPGAVIEKTETIALAPGQRETRTYDGATLTLNYTQTNATSIKIESSIDLPATMKPEDHAKWAQMYGGLRLSITGADGERWLEGGGSSSTSNTRLSSSRNWTSNVQGRPVTPSGPPKVTFTLITQVSEISIPFHLENIPLP